MAQVDSGLGWSCDEDYYVDDTTTNVGRGANKNNKGAAICCELRIAGSDVWAGGAVLSTVLEYAYVGAAYWVYKGVYTIDGVDWYFYFQSAMSSPRQNNFPIVYSSNVQADNIVGNMAEAANNILEAANVTLITPNKRIPSVNYVHKYVEGVLKGMPDGNISSLTEDQLTVLKKLLN